MPLSLALTLTLLLVGIALGAVLIALAQSHSVTLVFNGEARQLLTRAATVGALLAELNITLVDGDHISPAPDHPLSSNEVVRIDQARDVTLVVDGASRVIRTPLVGPLQILEDADVSVAQGDLVLVDGTETSVESLAIWPVPVTQIVVRHAITLNVLDDGSPSTIQTTSATVGDALFEAGLTLYLADSVTPELNTPVSPGLQVTITRSRPISIIADGMTVESRTRGSTVADALADAGIGLMGLDYAIPGETSTLLPGIAIRVIRVTEELLAEPEFIPFETVYQADSALELDQLNLIQEGQNGIVQRNVRVRYENGVEVSREVEDTTTLQETVNRVVAYGTNIVLRTVETPDGPRQYWRHIRMYATSYHPAALGGDNVTATGRTLTKGIVGVDPDVIPYFTELYIPGYGIGLAADTGGPRSTSRWIDLGYDDENWVSWSRDVDVYLLAPVPDNVIYVLPE